MEIERSVERHEIESSVERCEIERSVERHEIDRGKCLFQGKTHTLVRLVNIAVCVCIIIVFNETEPG